jgi:hypothetical protein
MANYSPLTKILMDNSVNRINYPKSKSPFHESSWIFQSKDVKNKPIQEDTKNSVSIIKPINNYEIKCVYKIDMKGYYKNVPIYRENRNKYIPKTKK